MNYPLISENVKAIKAAEGNFEQLSHFNTMLGVKHERSFRKYK